MKTAQKFSQEMAQEKGALPPSIQKATLKMDPGWGQVPKLEIQITHWHSPWGLVTVEGVLPHEIGVFVRSEAELPRATAAVQHTGVPFGVLDENDETSSGQVSISTMHLAKGLEFRAVAVVACDDEVIPSQARIETVGDEADLEEVYKTERHLLYVACTRARDHLLITSVAPGSEFLSDIRIWGGGLLH